MTMARKPTPSRTIGPLHFEDLEPHRFEDLVRQLVYDFRDWSQLEATGRSGSDDGFDARGFETFSVVPAIPPDDDEDEPDASLDQRLWLVQCKREKSITPKKLRDYLDAIALDQEQPLYGLIFAAACDFSKKARDDFRAKSRDFAIGEAYLWGKAEIEDMLFQPKNDHLLFAYFGISLQVRRRSLRTELRARLATKRKAQKVIANAWQLVLIRDASDDRYPTLDPDETKVRVNRGHWLVYQTGGCKHDGIHLLRYRHLAYIADDGVSWDYAEAMNDAKPDMHSNPWITDADKCELEKFRFERSKAMKIWDELEEKNKAWFELFLVLPYDKILAIDGDGDEYFQGPHIYVEPFVEQQNPFAPYWPFKLETIGYSKRDCDGDKDKRVEVFPRSAS